MEVASSTCSIAAHHEDINSSVMLVTGCRAEAEGPANEGSEVHPDDLQRVTRCEKFERILAHPAFEATA